MRRARRLDPESGDFAADASRRWARASSPLEVKLILAYTLPLGQWEGDPAIGHRFSELARAKDSAATRRRLSDLARLAAQWLVDGGDLDRVEVTVEHADRGKLRFQVDAYPPGQKQPVSVGPFFAAVAL